MINFPKKYRNLIRRYHLKMSFAKNAYGSLLSTVSVICGKDSAKKFDTKLRTGRKLDLKEPKTLADKVSWLELHEENDLKCTCTDKWAVRDYIRSKGFEDTLIETVGGPWTSFDEIDFDKLPDAFVLKATHGCKMNYFVPDKALLDKAACKKEVDRWLKTTYGRYSMELHYLKIPHRVYAESFLGDMKDLVDYKIHCMNGIPQFILTISDRKTNGDKAMQVMRNLFDTEWNPITGFVESEYKKEGNEVTPRPKTLEGMLRMASILSADFKFVRVDLYEKDNKILFGELTFTPACGVFSHYTEEFITEMGKKLKI